jgi:putative ABC transport system substrate-binding protein
VPALRGPGVRVTVIVAGGGEPAALAAKASTSTIPIVFTVDGDPVKAGLVTSLNRPGGNITGQVSFAGVLGTKRLGLRQVAVIVPIGGAPATVAAKAATATIPIVRLP